MDRETLKGAIPKNLQFRVGLLLGLALMLGIGFVGYVLFARGIFEATQRVTLIAENAEGVAIGMDLTFSGFPIGRVQRVALDEEGRARIDIEVPLKDAHWLRQTSVFTLERGLFGGATIRAHTGNLRDAPLDDGAVRPVLRGDTTEEIPRLVASLRSILDNVDSLTGPGGNLQASIANLRTVTERAAGKEGAAGAVLGDNVKQLTATLERTSTLLASVNSLVTKTEQRVFAAGGVLDETQRAVAQANDMLGDVREALKRADAILADAEKISCNNKAATTDIA